MLLLHDMYTKKYIQKPIHPRNDIIQRSFIVLYKVTN